MTQENNEGITDLPADKLTPQEEAAKITEDKAPAPSVAERQTEKAAKEAKEAEDKAKEISAEGDPEASPHIKDDAPKELDTSVWGDGEGDETAVSMLTELQNAGVSPTDAKALLYDAIQAGDPTLVDRDALVEKVGKHRANLIMAGVQHVTSKVAAQIKETSTTVHTAAGGEDNWKKAAAWAQTGVAKADLDEYRDMISKGGKQAAFAADQIVKLYNADPKNTSISGGKQITPDSAKVPEGKGLSRAEYGAQLQLLHRTRGTNAQYMALAARRSLGKKQGI